MPGINSACSLLYYVCIPQQVNQKHEHFSLVSHSKEALCNDLWKFACIKSLFCEQSVTLREEMRPSSSLAVASGRFVEVV